MLLVLFVISLGGSLFRADYNSAYSLLGYLLLATKRIGLRETINLLIVINLLVIGADAWAVVLELLKQGNPEFMSIWFKIATIASIGVEIILKILLLVMLCMWRSRSSKIREEDYANRHSMYY